MSDDQYTLVHAYTSAPVVGARKKDLTFGDYLYKFTLPLVVLGLIVLLGFQAWWMTKTDIRAVAPVAEVTPVDPAVLPDSTESDVTEPDATEPDATVPDATEPDATVPDATEPETAESETAESEDANSTPATE
jgi:hypothetical protein